MNDDKTKEDKPKVESEELILEILANAELHTEVTRQFTSTFNFYNKTLSEWAVQLAVAIPKNPTPDSLKVVYMELMVKLQQCSALYNRANTILTALSRGSASKKKEMVAGIIQMYEDKKARRPAGTIIDDMAETYINTNLSIINAKIARDFFKENKDNLIEIRKTLEQLGFLMHLEMKLGD